MRYSIRYVQWEGNESGIIPAIKLNSTLAIA